MTVDEARSNRDVAALYRAAILSAYDWFIHLALLFLTRK